MAFIIPVAFLKEVLGNERAQAATFEFTTNAMTNNKNIQIYDLTTREKRAVAVEKFKPTVNSVKRRFSCSVFDVGMHIYLVDSVARLEGQNVPLARSYITVQPLSLPDMDIDGKKVKSVNTVAAKVDGKERCYVPSPRENMKTRVFGGDHIAVYEEDDVEVGSGILKKAGPTTHYAAATAAETQNSFAVLEWTRDVPSALSEEAQDDVVGAFQKVLGFTVPAPAVPPPPPPAYSALFEEESAAPRGPAPNYKARVVESNNRRNVEGDKVVRAYWKVENSGTTAWPANTQLVYNAGIVEGRNIRSRVGGLKPGQTTTIEMDILVPKGLGLLTIVYIIKANGLMLEGGNLALNWGIEPPPNAPAAAPDEARTVSRVKPRDWRTPLE